MSNYLKIDDNFDDNQRETAHQITTSNTARSMQLHTSRRIRYSPRISGGQEAAGSSPVTRTNLEPLKTL